jgi:hypothetical protein
VGAQHPFVFDPNHDVNMKELLELPISKKIITRVEWTGVLA